MWKMLVGRMDIDGENGADKAWQGSSHICIPVSENMALELDCLAGCVPQLLSCLSPQSPYI